MADLGLGHPAATPADISDVPSGKTASMFISKAPSLRGGSLWLTNVWSFAGQKLIAVAAND
jgi:hypothetical protein